jgi:hypothetical protein
VFSLIAALLRSGFKNIGRTAVLQEAASDRFEARALLAALRRELGVSLEVLVALVEQVSADLGASPYIATDRRSRFTPLCAGGL